MGCFRSLVIIVILVLLGGKKVTEAKTCSSRTQEGNETVAHNPSDCVDGESKEDRRRTPASSSARKDPFFLHLSSSLACGAVAYLCYHNSIKAELVFDDTVCVAPSGKTKIK